MTAKNAIHFSVLPDDLAKWGDRTIRAMCLLARRSAEVKEPDKRFFGTQHGR
jgi:hypothetical protein